jgi:hypothetical protein
MSVRNCDLLSGMFLEILKLKKGTPDRPVVE